MFSKYVLFKKGHLDKRAGVWTPWIRHCPTLSTDLPQVDPVMSSSHRRHTRQNRPVCVVSGVAVWIRQLLSTCSGHPGQRRFQSTYLAKSTTVSRAQSTMNSGNVAGRVSASSWCSRESCAGRRPDCLSATDSDWPLWTSWLFHSCRRRSRSCWEWIHPSTPSHLRYDTTPLRRCVNLPRRRLLRSALTALIRLFGTHYWQEAQLSPRDRAMRRVNWNLANCHATVQKLLIRQVLNQTDGMKLEV